MADIQHPSVVVRFGAKERANVFAAIGKVRAAMYTQGVPNNDMDDFAKDVVACKAKGDSHIAVCQKWVTVVEVE